MAQGGQKDLLARLADAGRGGAPAARLVAGRRPGHRAVVTNMRDQVDALASKVRGIEQLGEAPRALERKVERLSKSSGSVRGNRTARKTTTSRKNRRRQKKES